MQKKLVKHGNSLALVLDRPILELVRIDGEQPVEISTDDGRRLIIQPVTDPEEQKKFRASLKRISDKHAKTLKRLSE
ncbi:MAG: AbrB/MazE/SpoVT family DNA-binding domain-containing protein [Tepidisphaeraceae bacterium]|jgi:antitoxin component of MazEF toxin-antitoxin module